MPVLRSVIFDRAFVDLPDLRRAAPVLACAESTIECLRNLNSDFDFHTRFGPWGGGAEKWFPYVSAFYPTGPGGKIL